MTDLNLTSRREKNLEKLRPRIIEAADRIVVSEGPNAINARKLAEAVKCSVGALYNAFPHLDAVVREVNLLTAARLEAKLRKAVQGLPTARERLVAAALSYNEFAKRNPSRWQALFLHPFGTPSDSRIEKRQEALIVFLEEIADLPGPSLDRVRLLWASVHGLVDLTHRGVMAGVDEQGVERYLHQLVHLALEAGDP